MSKRANFHSWIIDPFFFSCLYHNRISQFFNDQGIPISRSPTTYIQIKQNWNTSLQHTFNLTFLNFLFTSRRKQNTWAFVWVWAIDEKSKNSRSKDWPWRDPKNKNISITSDAKLYSSFKNISLCLELLRFQVWKE